MGAVDARCLLDGAPIVNHVGADLSRGIVVIAQPGGQVGQDSITYGGLVVPPFRLGEQVLVVLGRDYTRQLIPTEAGPAWDATFAYPVMATDRVVVSAPGKTEPLADLIATMRAAATSATPTP